MKGILISTVVIAFIITTLVLGVCALFGNPPTLGVVALCFGILCVIIGIPLLILSCIVCLINDGVSHVMDKTHAAYVKDLQQRGFTPQQIQDKVNDPGIFARHAGKLGIGTMILLVVFSPIVLPVLGIYAIHMFYGWRRVKEDVRDYDASMAARKKLSNTNTNAELYSAAPPPEWDGLR